jgi:hypothetical protein
MRTELQKHDRGGAESLSKIAHLRGVQVVETAPLTAFTAARRAQRGIPMNSVVQNHVEQRTVDLQRAFRPAGIVDEAQLSESVHEEADP